MNEKMPITSTLIITALMCLVVQSPKAQSLVINEFMSSNSITIADEDGDFEDWIELFNYGIEAIDLNQIGLSDCNDNPFRWTFPDVHILPGEYLIIWASGKDRRLPGYPLHTNFCISSAGEELLLTNPSGLRIDEVTPVALPTDISYGRQPDGNGGWYFFDEPTPGGSNTATGYSEVLDPPVFSRLGGIHFDEAFELTLSHHDQEVTIVYTTDGSAPHLENLDGKTYFYKNQYPQDPGDPFGDLISQTYSSKLFDPTYPIVIHDRSPLDNHLTQISTTFDFEPNYFPQVPVYKGMVVRARAIKPGAMPSKIETNSYFFYNPDLHSFSLPIVSLTIQEDYLFGYDDGVYTAGVDFDEWRLENPESPSSGFGPANYKRRGIEWEYPAHIEFFEFGEINASLKMDLGVRIHGGWSRKLPLKGLRLAARNRYCENNEIAYPFFSCQLNPYFDDPGEYRRLLLRAGGSTLDYLYDQVSTEIMRPLFNGVQRGAPVAHFINGEYWGIVHARDYQDQNHVASIFGIESENVVIVKEPTGYALPENVNAGKPEDVLLFNDMFGFIIENDMTAPENYDHVLSMLDIENYFDYKIMFVFLGNWDWKGYKHVKYWRARDPVSGYFGDGKWRVMVWDFDAGLDYSNVGENLLESALHPNGGGSFGSFSNPIRTAKLRSLLGNEELKRLFINRFADHMNSTFLPHRIEEITNNAFNIIEEENLHHKTRWQRQASRLSTVNKIVSFGNERSFYQRQHIIDQFDLDGLYELTLNVSNRWHGYVKVNTIGLTSDTPGIGNPVYPWSGYYYKGVPVTVEAIPANGFRFLHWEGDTLATDPVLVIDPTEDFVLTAHFGMDDTPLLTHYWLFDASLPNNQPLEEIESTYALTQPGLITFHSTLEGYPFDPTNPNWRKASLERRNSPTPINYRPEGNNNTPYTNSDMRGIQVKQPFTGDGGQNTMIFYLPTFNLKEPVFRFAAKDEGAADQLLLDYSVNAGEPQWITTGLSEPSPLLGQTYQLFEFDFSEIESTFDNLDFKIRIRFAGDNMSADEGNRVTFNNFSLDGVLISGINFPPVVAAPISLQKAVGEGEIVVIDLNDVFMDPENDPLVFAATSDRPQVADVVINQQTLSVIPLHQGDAQITVTAFDGTNDPVPTTFRVLVFPKPFLVAESTFVFDEWDADHPEHTYPDHMLFLQSNESDPGLYTQLLFPYFIAHNDYHDDDQPTIGFPYNNSRRTRINGLGEAGLSLINTGRDRDLGGVLLALDTRGAGELKMGWLAGTMQQNERKYALRLQYRTNIHQPFSNLFINVQPVEYIANTDGHIAVFEDIRLPQQLLELEYVQLLWRYYHLEGESGARAEIRLDDIEITDVVAIHEISAGEITLRRFGDQLHLTFPELISGELNLFDLTGRVILTKKLNHADQARVSLNNQKGVFIIRVVSRNDIWVKKVLNF